MGHGWQPNVEMAQSMIVPTLGVIGLHAAGLVQDVGALLLIEHVAMLAGMFGVMVARPEEYSGHHRHHHPVPHRTHRLPFDATGSPEKAPTIAIELARAAVARREERASARATDAEVVSAPVALAS